MSTLILKDYGVTLRYRKGLLVVTKNRQRLIETPISSVEEIWILTSGINISSKAVRATIRAGIDVFFMDHKGDVIGKIESPNHTRTIVTKRNQYLAYLDRRGLEIAKSLAYAKIRNQEGLIRYLARNRSDPALKEELIKAANQVNRTAEKLKLINAPNIDKARQIIINLEAEAAQIYWQAIVKILPPQLEFHARNQKANDIFNMMLNYAYAVLKGKCWKALTLTGLDPFAGYLHVDRSGRPSLVLDFMEQFRQPIVDRTLINITNQEGPSLKQHIEQNRLDREIRAKIIAEIHKRLNNKVRYHEEKLELKTIIKRKARELAKYLRKETSKYQPYIERW